MSEQRESNPPSRPPQGRMLPLHHAPLLEYYLILERDLIHFVQAFIFLPAKLLNFFLFIPAGIKTHCKLGYFLFLEVGLYFPRSFTNFLIILDFLAQIAHSFAMIGNAIIFLKSFQVII